MSEVQVSYDYAVHSDFLIHWTGKDIDGQYDPSWHEEHNSMTRQQVVVACYIKRLRDILRYGLWMTEEDEPQTFLVGPQTIHIPATPQCCFTELKLSESRKHARRYGRLGIGLKRPFLFQRSGRPLAYFGFGKDSDNDKFFKTCAVELTDKRLLNFFKPMNSDTSTLNYDLYGESEWRILYLKELLKRHKIIDPRDEQNVAEHNYFNSLPSESREKLKYLIPLDGWFAMIIYPSLPIKNYAQRDEDIVGLITKLKSKRSDHGNLVEGGNWPIEVNLDACRNF